MRDLALVQVEGPLAPFAEGFRARLGLLGYAPQSRVLHLRLMADLSSWLGERGLDGSAFEPGGHGWVSSWIVERPGTGTRGRSGR